MSESESESLTSEEEEPTGPYNPTTIGKLETSEKIYQGTENGSFCFRPHLGEKFGGSTQPMPGSALVALGLTEICCDLGHGKVETLAIPTTLENLLTILRCSMYPSLTCCRVVRPRKKK